MRVDIRRDGLIYSQEYKRGIPVTDVVKEQKPSDYQDGTGTTMTFIPDTEIFPHLNMTSMS